MIREATEADVDSIVAMGRRFLSETRYRGTIADNPAQMAVLARNLITNEVGVLLVSEAAGVLTGMFGAFLYVHPISGERMATELFWWVQPEHRGHGIRLLKHAERWARGQGAKALQMIAPTPDVEAIYSALGYSQVETAYQRTF